MSKQRIHGVRSTVSASSLLRALGDDLGRIRQEDGLTWEDIGRVFGKHGDTVAKYADATAEMGVTSFYFAKREWNGRFTGTADALIEAATAPVDPKNAQSCLLQAALALSVALEDGELTDAEIMANRKPLEDAADRIAKLLQRVKPRSVG